MSVNKWMTKLCYSYTKDHRSAIKNNELLIHTTTYMNLKIINFKKKAKPKIIKYESVHLWFHLYKILGTANYSIVTENWSVVVQRPQRLGKELQMGIRKLEGW